MASWCGWLLCACVVEAVRFGDRLLEKSPMKTFGQTFNIEELSRRQFIPGLSPHVPLIRGEHGPIATLLNVQESDEDAKASIKGLASYDGDLVVPRLSIPPVGYPMSLNVDKDPDDIERGDGPLFTLFPKDSARINKAADGRTMDISKLMDDKREEEKKEEEEKKKKEEEKKKKVEEEKRKSEEEERKKKEEEERKKKYEEESKKKEEDKKKLAQKLSEDRMNEVEKRKEEEKRKDAEERRKGIDRKKQEEEGKRKKPDLNKDKNNIADKKIVEQKNNETVAPRDKSFICYLPKIVVITRMVGTTIVNEVKVYGDSHNENSVHKFISTHDVSANASELVNEFTLPPQFILGVSPELERNSDISIAKTAAYTNAGQLYLPGARKPPLLPKPQRNLNYGPDFTTRQPTLRGGGEPTYNPFLLTKSSTTTPTTTPITTPPTTTQSTTTTRKTTTISLSGDIISDIITKKSKVKNIVPRGMLEWLNYAARHRNAMADIPGGDPNAFTGYEMMPPNYSI